MQAWMATYEEVKADAEAMAADEAARLESEALASLDGVDMWTLIDSYNGDWS